MSRKKSNGKLFELIHTSKLKSTPPMGAPNATEIPAAAAADNTSRFLAAYIVQFMRQSWIYRACNVPSFLLRLSKGFIIRFAQQQATWTRGPSFPSHKPDATERHCVETELGMYRVLQIIWPFLPAPKIL